MKRLGLWLFAAVIVIGALAAGRERMAAEAADFDFYVLSLSWSPSWCAQNDAGGRTAQCNGRRSYGFIVHGLWPQNERGWPESCRSDEPDRVPNSIVRTLFDIMPSAGLMGHEWRKHGTCSGLTQSLYFRQMKAAYDRIKLPALVFNGRLDRRLAVDDIERLMISANPGLQKDGISVGCDRGELSELRICMSKSLQFRSCGEVDRQSCRSRIVSIPAIQ